MLYHTPTQSANVALSPPWYCLGLSAPGTVRRRGLALYGVLGICVSVGCSLATEWQLCRNVSSCMLLVDNEEMSCISVYIKVRNPKKLHTVLDSIYACLQKLKELSFQKLSHLCCNNLNLQSSVSDLEFFKTRLKTEIVTSDDVLIPAMPF